jgi:O-methyltransferase involved in polyketide biosynthesis
MRIPKVKTKVSSLEGRYYSVNEAINRLGKNIPILEIAAGLSLRGLDFSKSHSVYLETDLEEIISQKEGITRDIRRKLNESFPENHIFQVLNATNYKQLKRAGDIIREKDNKNPIAIVHEGLLMYLKNNEQKDLRDNMYRFLTEYSPNGAWITSDFSYRAGKKTNPFFKIILNRIERKTGRKFNGFESDEKVIEFLNNGRLDVEFLPNQHIARNLSCIKNLNLNLADVLDHANNYRAAFITLKK